MQDRVTAWMRWTAGVGVAATLVSAILTAASPVGRALRRGDPILGILLGTDGVDLARHSDTLMLWRYDPAAARADVLSIPRDTKINLPGYQFTRINEVYAYNYRQKHSINDASRAVMAAVNHLLYFDDIVLEPRYFIHIDFSGFKKFIDILGGVDVHIDEPLDYDDNAGDYHFHKEPGDYHFGGDEALRYVRFRGKSGDRGRILRQMEFMKALSTKCASPVVAFRFPQLFFTVASSFHSNFRFWDMLCLLWETKHVDPDGVNPWLLPGQPKGAYWDVNRERTAFVLRQILGLPVQMDDELPAGLGTAQGVGAVTIKVWNGTRQGGLALDITRILRSHHFEVVEWGSINLRQTKTRVVDRSGHLDRARQVAESLGVRSVFSDVNLQKRVDVEVFLGDDAVGLSR